MRTFRAQLLVVFLLCTFAAAQNVSQSIAGLGSADLLTRATAARDLWILSQKNPDAVKPAIPALTKAVLDTDLNVRYMAMTALKNIGPDARGAIPELIKALNTFPGGTPALTGPPRYYADARTAAAEALGAIGPGAKEAIPALNKALSDQSRDVKEAAREALKRIGS